MISITNLTKSFGEKLIFNNIEFTFESGNHIGLIGDNGSGKSTLLNIISAREYFDSGMVTGIDKLNIGYLPQIPEFEENIIVEEYLKSSFDYLITLEEKIENENNPEAARKLIEEFEYLEGDLINTKIGKISFYFNINDDMKTRKLGSLSGGEKSRVLLAKILLSKPDTILLDEPTNHLDIEGIVFLENFLKSYKGSYIIVSHDRRFLNNCIDKILYINNKGIKKYNGNYNQFENQLNAELKREKELKVQQDAYIKKTEAFIRKNISGQKTKQAQSRRKTLENIERINLHNRENIPNFKWNDTFSSGNEIFRIENLSFFFGDKQIINNFSLLIRNEQKLAIIGRNGSGKSTFLRLLIGELIPNSGKIIKGNNVSMGYFNQELNIDNPNYTIIELLLNSIDYITLEEARSKLALAGFYKNDVFKKWSELSGGERAKFTILKLTLKKPNVIILDEPTNHLDIQSVKYLNDMLKSYDGTIIFSSHDRDLLKNISTDVLLIKESKIKQYSVDKIEDLFEEILKYSKPVKKRGSKKHNTKKILRSLKVQLRNLENEILANDQKLGIINSEFLKPEVNSDHNKLNKLIEKKSKIENLNWKLYICFDNILKEIDDYE